MIYKKLIIASLFSIIVLADCSDDDKNPVLSANYIREYVYSTDNVNVSTNAKDIYTSVNDAIILLIADGERTSTGQNRFNEIAYRINDMSFNQPIEKCFSVPCISESFNTIEVITNEAYNAGHPAGSSMNDIMDISYALPQKVIKSGYDLSINPQTTELLETFNNNKPHSFTSYTFQLILKEAPTTDGEYSFSIHYKTDEKDLDDVIRVKLKAN